MPPFPLPVRVAAQLLNTHEKSKPNANYGVLWERTSRHTSVFPTRTGGPPSALTEIMISFGLCGWGVQPVAAGSSFPQQDHRPARRLR